MDPRIDRGIARHVGRHVASTSVSRPEASPCATRPGGQGITAMTNDQDPSNEAPIDLAPLDPLVDARRFDALASNIVRDGMRARRGTTIALRSPSVMADVARWS